MIAGLKQPQDFEKFKENRVAFITFNYDRSLEYFLYTSFLNTFSQGWKEFQSKLKEYIPFKIIHVYGQVGEWVPLWEENLHFYRESSVSFKLIENLSEGIRVIGDPSVEDMKKEIRELVGKYKRIFFCGFGYAEENLGVIGFPITIEPNWKIFGTAKGMTPKEIREARGSLPKHISPLRGAFPRIEDKNTYDLLREYL